MLTERGLGERENHFLGAALLRKEEKDEVDGDGCGGKDTPEVAFESTWIGCELFRALTGILESVASRKGRDPEGITDRNKE